MPGYVLLTASRDTALRWRVGFADLGEKKKKGVGNEGKVNLWYP